MGLFNETEEEKKYRELIKTIKNSDLSYECIDPLVNYVIEVRDGKRENDFYDFDFLRGVIFNILDSDFDDVTELVNFFNDLIQKVKFLLPYRENTEGYENIKRMILNNFSFQDGIVAKGIFSEKFYSLFNSQFDYLQVMNIIAKDEFLVENFDKIVDFASQMAKEIDNPDELKREVIAYIHLLGSILSSDEDYLQKRITETRMKYGVYPGINEKTIASISREVQRARGLVKRLEVLEKKVDDYVLKVDSKTQNGIKELTDTINAGKSEIEIYSNDSVKKMQQDLADAKKELLEELNKYLVSLEETMKNNSDQVFNQLLIDAKEKIEQIRIVANNLSGTTTRELLRIQNQTQESLNTLKQYVESNPELKSSLKVAQDNEELMKAILDFTASQKGEATTGTVVPQTQILLPDTDFLVPKFEMTPGILHAFDRSIAFNERMKRIEERIQQLEANGYIIPEALREALPWYMMGKKIVYFYGPTQSGKTTIVDLLTKVVGTELLDGGKITEEHSITSFNDVRGVFDENALFYGLYYGKTVFYDEIDNGNPDNLIVLGTYSSKLVNKIDHPDKDILVQFAKRRFVPINANARLVAAGNTTGRGRNRQYTSRSRMDESSQERLVPIYVGYSEGVEEKIFGQNSSWYNFFKFFRDECYEWARTSSMDEAEGNLTTSDASTIVECVKENSMDASSLIKGIFIQTKDEDYLAFLHKVIKSRYSIEELNDEQIGNYNSALLSELNEQQIAEVFIYETEKILNKTRKLER